MPIENLLTKIIVNTNKLPYEKQKQLLEITQEWLSQAAFVNNEVSSTNTAAKGTPSYQPESLAYQSKEETTVSDSLEFQDFVSSDSSTSVSSKDDLVVNIIEERAYERKKLSIPIDFVSSGQLYKEVTKDLSAGGLFIKTKKQSKFKKNQKISMVFVLSEDKKPFKLTGKVIRVEAEGIAVQFHNISPFECVAIEEELNNPS